MTSLADTVGAEANAADCTMAIDAELSGLTGAGSIGDWRPIGVGDVIEGIAGPMVAGGVAGRA